MIKPNEVHLRWKVNESVAIWDHIAREIDKTRSQTRKAFGKTKGEKTGLAEVEFKQNT